MGAIFSTLFEQDKEEDEVLEEEKEEKMDAADRIAAEKKADIAIQETKRKTRIASAMAKKRKAEAADAMAAKKRAEAEAREAKRKKDAQAALTAKKKAEAAAALAAKKKAEAEAYKRKLAKAREAKRKAEEAERKRKAEEAERKRKQEAERKRKQEAERKRKQEAERKRKQEAARRAYEAEMKRKREAARKAREEAERKRQEAARKAREEAARKARKAAKARADLERSKQRHRRNAAKKATQRVKVCKNGTWNGVNLINAYKKVHTPTNIFSDMKLNEPAGGGFRVGNYNRKLFLRLVDSVRHGRFGSRESRCHKPKTYMRVGCYVNRDRAEKKMLATNFRHGHIRINLTTPVKNYPGKWVGYGRRKTFKRAHKQTDYWKTKTIIYSRGHAVKAYNGHLFVDGNRLVLRRAYGRRLGYLLDQTLARFGGNKGECAVVAVSPRGGTPRLLFVQSNNNAKSYDLISGEWINHPYPKCPTHAELAKKFCTINGKYKC